MATLQMVLVVLFFTFMGFTAFCMLWLMPARGKDIDDDSGHRRRWLTSASSPHRSVRLASHYTMFLDDFHSGGGGNKRGYVLNTLLAWTILALVILGLAATWLDLV